MKRKISLITFATMCLASCGIGPTPKLYTNFERANFNVSNALKEEWDRTEVNKDFSYICDFEHGTTGKAKNFVRVFYKGNQVFEETKDDSYMTRGAFVVSDTLYYVYDMFDDDPLKTVTVYCLKVDKDGQSSLFSFEGDFACHGACTDGEHCYFFLWDRQKDETHLVRTDLNGTIQSNSLSPIDNFCGGLHYYDGNLYSRDETYTYSDDGSIDYSSIETIIYKWPAIITEDYYGIGYYTFPGEVDILNIADQITAISHVESVKSFTFYKTIEGESEEICSFNIPDDLSYNYQGIKNFENDLVIGFTANRKDVTKSLYCRVIFLHYESSTNKIKSYCPNENLYNIIFKNNKVFYGKYSNNATNGTSDGDFKRIEIA